MTLSEKCFTNFLMRLWTARWNVKAKKNKMNVLFPLHFVLWVIAINYTRTEVCSKNGYCGTLDVIFHLCNNGWQNKILKIQIYATKPTLQYTQQHITANIQQTFLAITLRVICHTLYFLTFSLGFFLFLHFAKYGEKARRKSENDLERKG